MGKIPDNYVTVQERIEQFRNEYQTNGTIETELTATNNEYIIVRAKILVEGKAVSMAQALVSASDSDDKAFEKAESSAIGRALKFFKYSELSDGPSEKKKAPPSRRASDDDEDDEEPRRPAPKAKSKPTVEEDDEDEAPPPKKSAPPKRAAKADDDDEEEPPKPAGKTKTQASYEDLRKKYGADDEED